MEPKRGIRIIWAKNGVELGETCIMPSSSEYQVYAHECLRWADKADKDEDRRAFLEMAKVWTQLALHGDEAEPISEAAE
jgi:hypothetical protein